MATHRSSAVPLAGMYAALIVYASLYPFLGWRVPGVSPWAFLTLPWSRWWTGFDLVSNLLGYMPFGALLLGALVRSGIRLTRAFAIAVAAGSALSLSMELLQNYLPHRVSSNVDLALNIAGTLLGALLAAAVHTHGGLARWQIVRERWFIDRSAGGLTLLVLWPVGLLFPALAVVAGTAEGAGVIAIVLLLYYVLMTMPMVALYLARTYKNGVGRPIYVVNENESSR